MRKIISLFHRNYDGDRLVRDEVVPGAEWVLAGEGRPSQKWDGTACLIRAGFFYKRYDAKHGKTPPPGFEPAQPEADPVTGHWPGWVPVGDGPDDKWHREAVPAGSLVWPDGTYELIGRKVQGNPYNMTSHIIVRHGPYGEGELPEPEGGRTFEALRAYLTEKHIEGIVWHHEDGRMVKIKRRDFGLRWPVKEPQP